ncbi:MAG: fused MFS/spermidine synthase [Myxococcota bacterium]|nr:fused MFS/spermidine synthase [Myxococcota bacterium]
MQARLLAFLSGIPALVYQVVWTREVALLAGSQLDAIATVVATYFGGLALGSRVLGERVDRSPRPLRFYALLELLAAALTLAATLMLRALGTHAPAGAADWWGSPAVLAASGALVLPVTFLLGGTQPALLRSTGETSRRATGPAGEIQGVNTLGAVIGVILAALAIPWLGLWTTLCTAAGLAASVGGLALALDATGKRAEPIEPDRQEPRAPRALPVRILALAAAAGVATLGYEVLAVRMASIRLGSSLYAWTLVLSVFLAGLAAGNVALASTASQTRRPARLLGRIELASALALALGLVAIHPPLAHSAAGVEARALLAVVLGVLPAAFCMGGAFPLFARLVLDATPGRSFGALVAWNTAGGIAGALLTPVLLLPVFGMAGGVLVCAGINLAVGFGVLVWTPRKTESSRLGPATLASGVAFAGAAALGWLGVRQAQPLGAIHIEHGRLVSAVVVAHRGERELIVDGDQEAHTAPEARLAEELLAAVPLAVHPAPRRFLEIGFGAGITLGTASRFPLERLECVEIAGAVLRSAPWMEPANRGVLRDPRLTLYDLDARAFLRGVTPVYDVVVANTLHPWSLGATGLYSVEYFSRLRAGLAPGGIATQWIPASGIASASFRAILRTFFEAFEHGVVLWGEDNVILLGSAQVIELPEPGVLVARLAGAELDPRALRLAGPGGDSLAARRIGEASDVREVVDRDEILRDDRPRLEADAAFGVARRNSGIYRLLVELATRANARHAASPELLLWLESRAARLGSEPDRASAREALAEQQGLALARRSHARRIAAQASDQLRLGDRTRAGSLYVRAQEIDPTFRGSSLARSMLARDEGQPERAAQLLERWLQLHPDDPEAWNDLASLLAETGQLERAERAVEQALASNPFFPEALANAGLLAVARGDPERARALRDRLAALEHGRPRAELEALEQALERGR